MKGKKTAIQKSLDMLPMEYRIGEIGKYHKEVFGMIWDSLTKNKKEYGK